MESKRFRSRVRTDVDDVAPPVRGIEAARARRHGYRMRGLLTSGVLALGLAAAATAAHAADSPATITKPLTTLNLGNIVADSTASEFRVQAGTGTVTKVSGSAVRLTSAGAGVQTVTITCTGTGSCKTTYTVSIAAVSGTGRSTTITKFNIANFSVTAMSPAGSTVVLNPSSPVDAAPLTFGIQSNANTFTAKFDVGVNVQYNANAAPGGGGATAANYSVSVTP